MKNNSFALGSSLILWGLMTMFNFFGLTNVDLIKIFSFVFIFYGLVSIITSFKTIRRTQLFLTSLFLNTGILLYIISHYEILNWYNLVLPSILYFIGAGFLLLYIESYSGKSILVTSVFFFILSAVSIFFYKSNWIVQFAHKITLTLFSSWSFILILFGVLLIIGKTKLSSSSGSSSGRSIIETSE